MHRYYFLTDSLDKLISAQTDLRNNQFLPQQIHVLSNDNSVLGNHKLLSVNSILRSDIVHGGIIGAFLGSVGVLVILSVGIYFKNVTLIDWMPFLFLSVGFLFFSVWEGGLYGIQVSNIEFRRFAEELDEGQHVLFIDVGNTQVQALREIMNFHPSLEFVGEGVPESSFWFWWRRHYHAAVKAMP